MRSNRVDGSRDIQNRWHEVDQLTCLGVPLLLRRDLCWPVHEERSRRPALVCKVFVEAERGVARVRPGLAVAIVVLEVPLCDIVELAPPEHPAFLTGSIVGEEKEERIFNSPRLL